jgi:hypothetical protein
MASDAIGGGDGAMRDAACQRVGKEMEDMHETCVCLEWIYSCA